VTVEARLISGTFNPSVALLQTRTAGASMWITVAVMGEDGTLCLGRDLPESCGLKLTDTIKSPRITTMI
jgi:hypothetical protein